MRANRSRSIAQVALLLLLGDRLFAASFTGVTPAAKVEPINACALLSSREIGAVLQRKVEAAERNDAGYVGDGPYSSACVWKIPLQPSDAAPEVDQSAPDRAAAPLGGRHFVILNALRWPKGMAHQFLDEFYAAGERGDIPRKPVPRKIGDDALWWGDGVAVRKGDVSFGVSVFVEGVSLDESRRIEEALARKVLRKIGASTR